MEDIDQNNMITTDALPNHGQDFGEPRVPDWQDGGGKGNRP